MRLQRFALIQVYDNQGGVWTPDLHTRVPLEPKGYQGLEYLPEDQVSYLEVKCTLRQEEDEDAVTLGRK